MASLPADFADWLDYAAIVALLVYGWGHGPFVLAGFALALSLPYILVGPFAAVIVDRASIRSVLVASNIGRGFATLGLAFAGDAAVLLVLVFVRGSIDSAFTPARQAALQATTPVHLLGHANGLHQAINQTSKIAGPAIGGLLLAFWPAQNVFLLNSGLSLIAALIALTLVIPPRELREERGRFFTQSLVGITEFRRSRRLLVALVFSAFAYFSFFLYDALIALLAEGFGFGPTAFGFSISASGLGGLIGALMAGRIAAEHPIATMAVAAIISGLTTTIVAIGAMSGWPLHLAMFLLVLALMGGATAFMLVPYRTIVQAEAPPDRIGRVFAAGEAVVTLTMLSAPLVGSVIAARWGTPAAFLVGGCLLVSLGAVTIANARRD